MSGNNIKTSYTIDGDITNDSSGPWYIGVNSSDYTVSDVSSVISGINDRLTKIEERLKILTEPNKTQIETYKLLSDAYDKYVVLDNLLKK